MEKETIILESLEVTQGFGVDFYDYKSDGKKVLDVILAFASQNSEKIVVYSHSLSQKREPVVGKKSSFCWCCNSRSEVPDPNPNCDKKLGRETLSLVLDIYYQKK